MKQTQTIVKRTFKSASIFSFIIACTVLLLCGLYWTLDSPFERLLISALGFFILVPMFITIINFIINLSCSGKVNDKDKAIVNKVANDPIKKYKKKEVQTEGYKEFNNLLKSSIQNKLMDRECVLKLKYELLRLLGTHMEVYKDFDFKNDIHCIYVLSKSSKLQPSDYSYLSKFLSDNLILPK